MAHPAADHARAARATLGLLVQATPQRAELALRLALICVLTTMVTEYYGTPEAALSAYIVFFLNRPDRTTSLIFNVALPLLVTLILVIVLLLAIAVVDEPAWRVAAMALGSVAFLFLASASKLRPVGAILAMILAYGLDELGFVPVGELATRGLLYTWLFVAIPAGVSLATNLLIAPAPGRLAGKAIAVRLRAAAAVLADPDAADVALFARLRDAGMADILKLLHLAHVERTISHADEPRLRTAALSTNALLFMTDAIRHDDHVPRDWRIEVAATLRAMASAFDAGGYPTAIQPPSSSHEQAEASGAALMHDFGEMIAGFADPVAMAAAPTKESGFLLPDAFTNPEHLHYALKTTVAAMACYFLYVLLDWPGIHTCLITCYIVALATTAETVEKLGLRILGCLAGAAFGTAAILWVIPALDSVWALLAVVFAGAFVGAWIAAGSPRIAYAGFQFAFAFFLCVIQGAGPAFDLTIARDRVIGILIGNAVTYLIFTRVWPTSVSDRVECGLAALLRELGALARLPLAERRQRAPALQAHVAVVRDDLDLTGYEPASLRPSAEWSASREEALRALVALEGPLLTDRAPDFWNRCAQRLDRLADRIAAPPSFDQPPAANPPQMRAREQILTLERALAAQA